jgi:hypothetical protein
MKELHQYDRAAGTNQAAANFESSPVGKMAAYQSSMKNLQVALGQSLIPLFTQLAVALKGPIQAVTEWIRHNQKLTKYLFVFGIIGGALLTLAGILGLVVTLAPVVATGLGAIWAALASVAGVIGGVVAGVLQTWTVWLGLIGVLGIGAGLLWGVYSAFSALFDYLDTIIPGLKKLNPAYGYMNHPASVINPNFSQIQEGVGRHIGMPGTSGAFQYPNMLNSNNKVSVTNHITVNESKEGLASAKALINNSVNPTLGFGSTYSPRVATITP